MEAELREKSIESEFWGWKTRNCGIQELTEFGVGEIGQFG